MGDVTTRGLLAIGGLVVAGPLGLAGVALGLVLRGYLLRRPAA